MEQDLDFGIEIISAPTAREPSGLAMSSRNNYLDDKQRNEIAPGLYAELSAIRDSILAGKRDYVRLQSQSTGNLNQQGFRTDYIEVRNANDLSVAQSNDRELVILVSAWLGKARLIDNSILKIKREQNNL